MGKEEQLSFTEEFQLLNVEEMRGIKKIIIRKPYN